MCVRLIAWQSYRKNRKYTTAMMTSRKTTQGAHLVSLAIKFRCLAFQANFFESCTSFLLVDDISVGWQASGLVVWFLLCHNTRSGTHNTPVSVSPRFNRSSMFFLITPCTSASSALSADMLLLLASGFAYTFFRRWLINLSAQQQQQQQHIGWHKGEPKWRGGLLLVNTCVGWLPGCTHQT